LVSVASKRPIVTSEDMRRVVGRMQVQPPRRHNYRSYLSGILVFFLPAIIV